MTPNIIHVLLRACVGAALALAGAAHSAEDFSPAERALFMTNQLAGLRPPMTLRYTYNKSGSLEEGFNDAVNIHLRAQSSGDCCTANADFLTGARRLSLPEIEAGVGNPVLLYFLERDIREMSRLTKGQMNYFRKRIRMAVFQGAQISDVNLPYRGKTVAARQITITPYTGRPTARALRKTRQQTVHLHCVGRGSRRRGVDPHPHRCGRRRCATADPGRNAPRRRDRSTPHAVTLHMSNAHNPAMKPTRTLLVTTALLSGLAPTWANDFPTADRVLYVQECMKANPGPIIRNGQQVFLCP